ncbi:MAG: hypothetical protein NT049_11030 [Planctomycetota bacterium]|nr:hypothetical protein [Planctomycetota bacterium]
MMRRWRPAVGSFLAASFVLWACGQASAGRFEDFTKKAVAGKGLKTLAATYFGGPGAEEFVAAGGQADGTVVAFGNAWGPAFPQTPVPVVLGKGKRCDVPDFTTDAKGKVSYDRANPNVAGMIVRYSPDLRKIVGVMRFDWGVASIEAGLVVPDGLLIAGRCSEALPAAAGAAVLGKIPAPTEEPSTDKKKEGRFGPTAYQGAPVSGDVYVAKLSPDAGRIVWVHILQGHRMPPARLLPTKGGAILFECNGIRSVSADGKSMATLTQNISEGDRVKLLAANPQDGAFLHGGDRNTRTNKEPWRQPFLNLFAADGQKQWTVWNWDSKSVGSDQKKLESDSACRAAAWAANGDIIVGGWSDGGNSVFTREIKDVDAPLPKGLPGYGMTCWGMRGANSIAYLMRFDPKTFQMRAWTLWVAYVPQDPTDPKKGGNPNFAKISRLEVLPDGSIFWFGQAATGLVETPQAWFSYADGARMGGSYVAVFSGDFTNLIFSSYVPTCEVQGIGQAKGGLLVAGRAGAKAEGGQGAPVESAVQKDHGGALDAHLILLESPVPAK